MDSLADVSTSLASSAYHYEVYLEDFEERSRLMVTIACIKLEAVQLIFCDTFPSIASQHDGSLIGAMCPRLIGLIGS